MGKLLDTINNRLKMIYSLSPFQLDLEPDGKIRFRLQFHEKWGGMFVKVPALIMMSLLHNNMNLLTVNGSNLFYIWSMLLLLYFGITS